MPQCFQTIEPTGETAGVCAKGRLAGATKLGDAENPAFDLSCHPILRRQLRLQVFAEFALLVSTLHPQRDGVSVVLVLVPIFRGEAAAPKGWIDLHYGGAPWRDDPTINLKTAVDGSA